MIGNETTDGLGVRWRVLHGSLVPFSFPHKLGGISESDAKRLVRTSGARLIRWESAFDIPEPTEWWHVIKDVQEDISELKQKVRYAVRQGGENFVIRRCGREEILLHGYPVYVSAFERYQTFEKCMSSVEFYQAIAKMPDEVEFWIVEDRKDGGMRAFAENIVMDDCCFYSSMWFTAEALKRSGAYALVHAMNSHYLNERGFRYVSDGARNISHQTKIHEFLQGKFRFRKAYCRLKVEYCWWVSVAVLVSYPFRVPLKLIRLSARLDVLLEQERIRRACI